MAKSIIFCVFSLLFLSCGGSLSDEKRQALKKEMEDRKIKKVSEEEIYIKALETGRLIALQLKKDSSVNKAISEKYQVSIHWIGSNSENLTELENDIYQAYAYSDLSKDLAADNVQKKQDTLFYSMPILKDDSLKGMWLIGLPQKQIILSL